MDYVSKGKPKENTMSATITPEDIAHLYNLAAILPITDNSARCDICKDTAAFDITYSPCECAAISLTLCPACTNNPGTWHDVCVDNRCHQPAECGYDR
jgi:hypothetical protein